MSESEKVETKAAPSTRLVTGIVEPRGQSCAIETMEVVALFGWNMTIS